LDFQKDHPTSQRARRARRAFRLFHWLLLGLPETQQQKTTGATWTL